LRSADSDNEDQWWVPRADTLAWRTWDEEIVLFDDRSDETHHFDIATAAVFEMLVAKPASMRDVAAMLADRLQVQTDGELVGMVHEIVRILHDKHIISIKRKHTDATGLQ